MSDIKVSVICITYNQEKYLGKCIESVIEQSCTFSMELLIGVDASDDNTAFIADSYKKKYPDIIKVYVRKQKYGPSKNAYDLVMKARGEYLAFCEGDDYWIDECKIQKQVLFLDKHMEYIGCASQSLLVDENGKALNKQKLVWTTNKQVFSIKDFKGIYLPGQTSSVVKRNIFLKSNTDFSYIYKINPMISDRANMLLWLSRGDFYVFPSKMNAYRIRNDGVTNTVFKDNWAKKELDYTEKLEVIAEKLGLSKYIFHNFYCQLYYISLRDYRLFHDTKDKDIAKKAANHFGGGLIHPIAYLVGRYYIKLGA